MSNYRNSDYYKNSKYQDRMDKVIQEFEDQLKEWQNDEYANSKNRDELGQFYTPPDLASHMIEKSLENDVDLEETLRNEPIMDPTAGSGNLMAAALGYGFNPEHVFNNELDPEIVEKRLLPRMKKLGVPRRNIYPWPAQYRRYGKMGEEISDDRIESLYNDYVKEHPDWYKKNNKGEWVPNPKVKNENGETAGISLDYLKKNSYAGNALNKPYFDEFITLVKGLNDSPEAIALVDDMFKAEEEGDEAKANTLYLKALALCKGYDAAEEEIENGEVDNVEGPLQEEINDLKDDDKRNDEVSNEALKEGLDEINPSKKVYEDLLNKYKDYIYKSPDEFANWPLQANEQDYIRNQLFDALPPGVGDLLAMRRWDSEEHDENDSMWHPNPQSYDFALENALEDAGLQWNNERLLPGNEESEGSNLTYDDIRRMDNETKSKLTDYILDYYSDDVRGLMEQLDDIIPDWKYEYATGEGYKGSYDDFMRSFRETSEDKLYEALEREYPDEVEDEVDLGQGLNYNQDEKFPINLTTKDIPDANPVEKPIVPFQDYALGMLNKEMEDDKIDLQNALKEKNGPKVENIIETNPVAASEVVPENSPLRKEVNDMFDGDKRNDEVSNNAVSEALPIRKVKPPVINPNYSFDEFSQLSPASQKTRLKFNEKYNMDDSLKSALHDFSSDIDKEHEKRERERAADDYMDNEEKGEVAEWLDKNLPVPPEEETKEEEKKLHIPHIPLEESKRLNGLSVQSSSTPVNDINLRRSRVGSGMLGGGRIPISLNRSSGNIHPSYAGIANDSERKPDSTYSRASRAPIPPRESNRGMGMMRSGSNNISPSGNGSVSSGAGLIASKRTAYTAPRSTAPSIPILGHNSVIANAEVPQVGRASNKGYKQVLINQLESKLNELALEDPKKIESLGFDHKYEHWSWNGIALDELSANQLNDLLKILN